MSWRAGELVSWWVSLTKFRYLTISFFIIARSAATTQSPIVTTNNCHCEARSAEATPRLAGELASLRAGEFSLLLIFHCSLLIALMASWRVFYFVTLWLCDSNKFYLRIKKNCNFAAGWVERFDWLQPLEKMLKQYFLPSIFRSSLIFTFIYKLNKTVYHGIFIHIRVRFWRTSG